MFEVANCDADKLNYSTRAFTHFATRRMMIKRACNPVGPGLRGLITANVVHNGRVKRGSVALVIFTAPTGTRMTTFDWGGSARRRDCRYALEMYAEVVPGVKAFSMLNVKANSRCASAGRAQAAYLVGEFKIPGATRIVQRVICKGKGRRDWCSARGLNYIRTRHATVELVDDVPPVVQILPDTPLAAGAWVAGTQSLKAHGLSYDEIGARCGWSYTKTNRAITEGRRRFMAVYEAIESGEECGRFAGIVEALSTGSASAAQVLQIRPHLRHCTACRATVRDLHLSRLRRASLFWPVFAVAEPLARLPTLKHDAAALFHRAQASDLATGAGVAGSGGGGRIATVGAVLGLCLGGAGVGTVCVVTDRVPVLGSDPARQASRSESKAKIEHATCAASGRGGDRETGGAGDVPA